MNKTIKKKTVNRISVIGLTVFKFILFGVAVLFPH